MELVYPPVIAAARGFFLARGLRFTIEGAEHIPRTGGAVLASNHVSYLDFVWVGLAARPSKRLVRFMAKDAVFTHKIAGPLMRGMKHIPVDRNAGAASFRAAVEDLRAGEVVGVFPEGTMSRSFRLKEIKSGSARMARSTGTPLIPVATWGGQRLAYYDKRASFKHYGVPILIAVGEPLDIGPRDNPEVATVELKRRIEALVEHIQEAYPDRPAAGEDPWWLPAAMGGTAPTPEEAAALDEERAAGRDEDYRKRARESGN